MNHTVPGAKNWPDLEKKDKRLRAKRSGLTPINSRPEFDDAEARLIHLTRGFQKQQPGRLIGFVSAFAYRNKKGEMRVQYSGHGDVGLANQIAMARKLERWLESDE